MVLRGIGGTTNGYMGHHLEGYLTVIRREPLKNIEGS